MRARELGIEIGFGAPGPFNAITDVEGVVVGQATIIRGEGPLVVGEGPVRTGVTVVLPHDGLLAEDPVLAGAATLNGNGELTGLAWLRESGFLMSPIGLTNSHSVGVVRDALVGEEIRRREARRAQAAGGAPRRLYWSLPVVGETWDGLLNDIDGRHVTEEHVRAALDSAAGGPVAEGNVGGGTGMVCHDFKGGIGTASRLVDCVDGASSGVLVRPAAGAGAVTDEAASGPSRALGSEAGAGFSGPAGSGADASAAAEVPAPAPGARRFTVGVLVQANHGGRERFQVNGAPVGQVLNAEVIPLPLTPEERAAAEQSGAQAGSGSGTRWASSGAAPGARMSPGGAGSIIVVVATDAPLLPHQCERLARRAGMGIAALGAYGGHYSGDLFVCFSTANRGLPAAHYTAASPLTAGVEMLSNTFIDALFAAVAEATQEAILNAMLQAETMVGRDGVTAHALDGAALVDILDRFGRRRFAL